MISIFNLIHAVRTGEPERTLAQLAEVRDQGLIGVGLGGSEPQFPPEPFAPVFAEARHLGFHTTAHAGEAAGAASVRGALEALQVERIGHGTRAVEDPVVLELMAARGVAVELCPVSNLRTGVIPALAAHPIRRFLAAGIRVSVNTDDPAMFDTTLAGEYQALVEELDFTPEEIRDLVLSSVASSWLNEDQRAVLRRKVAADFDL